MTKLILVFFCVLAGSVISGRAESVLSASPPVVKGLSWTFYQKSCPALENIVKRRIDFYLRQDITQAAGLLRLHFHDCFVKGCDGSVLLDGSASGPSEQDAPPNLTLRAKAFLMINDIKQRVDKACGVVVSCADIVALAARDSVAGAGGPKYRTPLGRRDSQTFASRQETLDNLPAPTSNASALITALSAKGLDATDLVAVSVICFYFFYSSSEDDHERVVSTVIVIVLSFLLLTTGGHTIGIAHCSSFTNRLYPTQDASLNPRFAKGLYRTCPAQNSTNTTVLDIRTPNVFDNKYYVDLRNREGLFTSDQDLYTDSRTKPIVTSFALNQTLFFEKFELAMVKMGQLSVLTGNRGEIRVNCSAPNPSSYISTLADLAEEMIDSADQPCFGNSRMTCAEQNHVKG